LKGSITDAHIAYHELKGSLDDFYNGRIPPILADFTEEKGKNGGGGGSELVGFDFSLPAEFLNTAVDP
jgi:hypothetical protein